MSGPDFALLKLEEVCFARAAVGGSGFVFLAGPGGLNGAGRFGGPVVELVGTRENDIMTTCQTPGQAST